MLPHYAIMMGDDFSIFIESQRTFSRNLKI